MIETFQAVLPHGITLSCRASGPAGAPVLVFLHGFPEAAFVWDGRDDEGMPVPAGAYVARAETIPDRAEPARSGSLALTVMDR